MKIEITGEQLKTKIKESGFKLSYIAQQLGMSNQLLHKRLKTKNLSYAFLTSVMRILNVDEDFFVTSNTHEDFNVIKERAERIETCINWLKFKGIIKSISELGEKIGYSKTYIDQTCNSQIVPTEVFIDALLKMDKLINREWLWRGRGEMFKKDPIITQQCKGTIVSLPYIPVHDRARFLRDMEHTIEWETFPVYTEKKEDQIMKCFVFEIDGDLMEPTLQPGTKVLIQEIDKDNWSHITGVIVINYADSLAIKRIDKNMLLSTGILTLSSDNPSGGLMEVRKSEIFKIYKILRIVDAMVK